MARYTKAELAAAQDAKGALYEATMDHATECECALCEAALILYSVQTRTEYRAVTAKLARSLGVRCQPDGVLRSK